jgi:hypothetical protein
MKVAVFYFKTGRKHFSPGALQFIIHSRPSILHFVECAFDPVLLNKVTINTESGESSSHTHVLILFFLYG